MRGMRVMTMLYFAYGLNIDEEQMAQCCPDAEMVGIGELCGYRFIINNRGCPTLLTDQKGSVSGIVWRTTPLHEAALDRCEGFRVGLYDKCCRTVTLCGKETVQALVYIDHANQALGLSRDGCLERIIASAGGLLEENMMVLCNWPEKRDFRAFNRLVGRIRTGNHVSENLARHGGALAVYLKKARRELFLQALDRVLESPVIRLEDALEKVVLQRAKTQACQYDLELAGRCALEYASVERFKGRIAQVRQRKHLPKELARMNCLPELAGRGIVMSANPNRPHAPQDRFVVSVNAPALAALWNLLFQQGPVTPPSIRSFLDVFADSAQHHRNIEMSHGDFQGLLDRVEALAGERQGELCAEICSLGRREDSPAD